MRTVATFPSTSSGSEKENRRWITGGASRMRTPIGYSQILRGHVDSIARAINVANAQPATQGVANVNPIFTWVRLAQRIPVRIQIDEMPPGVVLSAGMTATVEIDIRDRGRGMWVRDPNPSRSGIWAPHHIRSGVVGAGLIGVQQ